MAKQAFYILFELIILLLNYDLELMLELVHVRQSISELCFALT